MKKTITKGMKNIKGFLLNNSKALKLFTLLAVSGSSIATAQVASRNGQNSAIANAPISIACNPITAIDMVDLGYDKIITEWNNSMNYDSIFLRVTISGSVNSRIISLAGSPNPGGFIIQGLSSQTTYDVEISAKCGTNITPWSTPLTVTTLIEPGPRFSVSAQTNYHNLNLTPNPADQLTKISFTAQKSQLSFTIEIADQSGRMIYSQSVISRSGYNEIPVDITTLAPGLYFVTLTNEKYTSVKKLVVY